MTNEQSMSNKRSMPVEPLLAASGEQVVLPSTEPGLTAEHAIPIIQFSTDKYRVNRNESGSTIIAVTRIGNSAGDASVNYATKGGTATAGIDYTSVVGTLTFVDGETRKTFTVPITESLSEDNTTVELELSNPQSAKLGSPSKAVLVIMSAAAFRNYYTNPFIGFVTNPNTLRVLTHILLVFSLIVGTYLLSKSITYGVKRNSDEWLAYLTPNSQTELVFPEGTSIAAGEQARLKDQLRRIERRIVFHLKVMEFYYTRYYMAIVTFSLTAALAAITLILISKRGWEDTNEYIITIFFVMTAASVFYGSFPGVFEQEQNITDNKVFYLKYVALENEVLSYAATNEALNYTVTNEDLKNQLATTQTEPPTLATGKNKAPNPKTVDTQNQESEIGISLSAKDFIHYIDLQLAKDNVAIGFDYGQIPNYKNAFSTE